MKKNEEKPNAPSVNTLLLKTLLTQAGYVWMCSEMTLETKKLYVETAKVLLKVYNKILMTLLGDSLIFAGNPLL